MFDVHAFISYKEEGEEEEREIERAILKMLKNQWCRMNE